jgi:DNA-binding XRE family transcriptional regulator
MARSKWKNRADGRTVRRHQIPPGQQWTWWSIEMMESPAHRALNLSERRIVDRIRIELGHHAGQDNGRLPVTFRDFIKYGVRVHSIAPGIRAVEALGFIRVTQWGIASNSEFKVPTKFALTHLPTNRDQDAATNDWQAIKTQEDAEAIAKAARNAPSRYGKFHKKRSQKTDLRCRNGIQIDAETASKTDGTWMPKRHHCLNAETASLSISRGGGPGTAGIGHNQGPLLDEQDLRPGSTPTTVEPVSRKSEIKKVEAARRRKEAWKLFEEGNSQQRIAEKLGVSQPTISGYLRGDSNPDWHTWSTPTIVEVFGAERDAILWRQRLEDVSARWDGYWDSRDPPSRWVRIPF